MAVTVAVIVDVAVRLAVAGGGGHKGRLVQLGLPGWQQPDRSIVGVIVGVAVGVAVAVTVGVIVDVAVEVAVLGGGGGHKGRPEQSGLPGWQQPDRSIVAVKVGVAVDGIGVGCLLPAPVAYGSGGHGPPAGSHCAWTLCGASHQIITTKKVVTRRPAAILDVFIQPSV